jgi:hypothetical protein
VPGFRHEAQRRVSAIAPAEPREKRAATVDVLVFGCYQEEAAAAGFVHR